MSAPTARASERRLATLLGVYVAGSLLTRGVVLFADIINGDEASYVVGAREILSGHLPYLTFADNKPPLIYLYYALIQLVAGPGIVAVRLVTTLVTVPLTALAVSAFYDHERRGIVAALAFLAASASFDASNMLAVNCESRHGAPARVGAGARSERTGLRAVARSAGRHRPRYFSRAIRWTIR
jgi:hypothetical protein